MDRAAVDILEPHGWVQAEGDAFPTERELVEQYLEPLASSSCCTPAVAAPVAVTLGGLRSTPRATGESCC